jgi:hypothetical protein
MGEVIERPDQLISAIEPAPALHEHYVEIQQRIAHEALGDTGPSAVVRSVDRIMEYMAQGWVAP